MACFAAVESQLSASDVDTLKAAGLTPADVIAWIAAHTSQGVDLFRKLLPLLPFDPNVKAVIVTILDLLFPVPTSA